MARRVETIAEGAEFDEERTTKVKDVSGEKWIDRTAQSKRTNTLRERENGCRVLEVNPRDQLRRAWSRNQSTTWSTKTSSMTMAHAWLGAQQLGSVTWVQVLEYVCECNEYEHKNTGTWDNHLFRSNPNLVLGSSVKSAAGEDPVPGI